jgi:hypothetical protein
VFAKQAQGQDSVPQKKKKKNYHQKKSKSKP